MKTNIATANFEFTLYKRQIFWPLVGTAVLSFTFKTNRETLKSCGKFRQNNYSMHLD